MGASAVLQVRNASEDEPPWLQGNAPLCSSPRRLEKAVHRRRPQPKREPRAASAEGRKKQSSSRALTPFDLRCVESGAFSSPCRFRLAFNCEASAHCPHSRCTCRSAPPKKALVSNCSKSPPTNHRLRGSYDPIKDLTHLGVVEIKRGRRDGWRKGREDSAAKRRNEGHTKIDQTCGGGDWGAVDVKPYCFTDHGPTIRRTYISTNTRKREGGEMEDGRRK